jgi:P27 family predicted phage terminase small subunit
MRGRKPTATVLKVLRGNPGKRRINQDEPQPADLSLECPDELTEPDARTEWTRVIVPAIQRGQITADDRIFAVAHCELWATWRSQLITAAKHAHVVAGKDGRPVRNPARLMANDTLKMLVRVDEVLGLSPTSRARVHVGNESGNALEAALA